MATHGAPTQHSTDINSQEHAHPTQRSYIKIAAILSAITIAEVAIYYVEALEGVLVPMLIVMSVVKFVMVVAFFMHLKFDDRRLAYIFAAALILTLSVVIALDVLQSTNVIEYATDFLVAED